MNPKLAEKQSPPLLLRWRGETQRAQCVRAREIERRKSEVTVDLCEDLCHRLVCRLATIAIDSSEPDAQTGLGISMYTRVYVCVCVNTYTNVIHPGISSKCTFSSKQDVTSRKFRLLNNQSLQCSIYYVDSCFYDIIKQCWQIILF